MKTFVHGSFVFYSFSRVPIQATQVSVPVKATHYLKSGGASYYAAIELKKSIYIRKYIRTYTKTYNGTSG